MKNYFDKNGREVKEGDTIKFSLYDGILNKEFVVEKDDEYGLYPPLMKYLEFVIVNKIYEIRIPFHWYEGDLTKSLTIRKKTLSEAKKVKDDFERHLKFQREGHIDSSDRILKFYDVYGDGSVGGDEIKIYEISENEL